MSGVFVHILPDVSAGVYLSFYAVRVHAWNIAYIRIEQMQYSCWHR